jgi:hypothetical protein
MSTLSNDDKDLAQKLLIAGGVAVVVAGVAYGVYRFVSQRSKETPEEVFTRAFPSGKDQPIETVRKFFRALPRVDAVHLNFWLYIADQNSDGQISKEEFARVWRVASYNNKVPPLLRFLCCLFLLMIFVLWRFGCWTPITTVL